MEKLVITPRVKPKGFFFPPVEETESTRGKRGQIQGARIVAKPARKLKNSRKSTGTSFLTWGDLLYDEAPRKVTGFSLKKVENLN
jgi:hypothetical protein